MASTVTTETTTPSVHKSVLIIIALFGLFRFSLSIAEAITLSHDSRLQGSCSQVWIQVLVMCVIGLVLNTFTLCGTLPYILTELQIQPPSNRGELMQLGGLGVHIWIQYTYFNISDTCRASYQENASTLWSMFLIEWVMFWVYLGLGLLCIVVMCCGVCSTGAAVHVQKRQIEANHV